MEQFKKHKIIFLYVLITLIISWAYELFIITNGGVREFGLLWMIALMWIPAVVSLGFRFATPIKFHDLKFKVKDYKSLALAILIPLLIAFIVGFLSSLLDIRHFALIESSRFELAVPQLVVILLLGIFGALGEELGWRGFLFQQMRQQNFPHKIWILGIVWALWHLPVVCLAGYYQLENPWVVALLYTMAILAFNYFLCALMLKTESLTVVTAAHAAHNYFLQLLVPLIFFTETGFKDNWWEIVGSDAGLFVTALYLLTIPLLYKLKITQKWFES